MEVFRTIQIQRKLGNKSIHSRAWGNENSLLLLQRSDLSFSGLIKEKILIVANL
jgi:hypothetical protein